MQILEITYSLTKKRRMGRVLIVEPASDEEAIAKAKAVIENRHKGHEYEIDMPLLGQHRLKFKDGICHDWGWY